MFDEARLERLIAAYFDQELTAEEKRELEEMLLASSRAREIFLDRSDWHGLLREQALQGQISLLSEDPAGAITKKVTPFRKKAWAVGALAACIALGWWVFPRSPEEPSKIAGKKVSSNPDQVAMLAQAIDVKWETGSGSFGVGAALPRGWLKISSGTLRLDFYSGARVILEGPAAIELLSPDLARLETGKLTARVPPPAEGFTVLSSTLKVVDRGTEFGMNVSGAEACEVHVFDGEVELQGDLPATAEKSLQEGKAVAIRSGQWSAFPADRSSFMDTATVMSAAARDTENRWKAWSASSRALRDSSDLKIYFDFEDLEAGDPILRNLAGAADHGSDGTVIGCDPLPGRWGRKGALGFAKTSDRVRFRATGTTPSMTLAAWVRVDSLPQSHNHLFSMSPEKQGEVHWKIDRSGRLVLGIRAEAKLSYDAWERLESPQIVTEQDFGRWVFLASVIDGEKGLIKHYVDGEEVASGPLKRRTALQWGMANLGNLDAVVPERQDAGGARSFNGRIDEFALFARALSPSEIADLK